MNEPRDALFIIHGNSLLQAVAPVLRRSNFTIHRMAADAGCIELVHSLPFALIVVEAPVQGISMESIVTEIRTPSSASRTAGLIVVADEEAFQELSRLVGKGVNRLVSRSSGESELVAGLAELMTVEPRQSLRAALRAQIKASSTSNTIMGQTENISASGILIRGSNRRFPVGSEISFQLALPGSREPIRGRGIVVRHADRQTEGIQGFAIRFTNFSGGDARRLDSYLAGKKP